MLFSVQTPAAGGTAFAQFAAAWCYDGNGYILNDTGTSLDVRIGASGSIQTLAAGGTLPIKLVYSMAELYVRRTDQSTTQVTVEAQVGTGSAGGGGSTADMAVISAQAAAAAVAGLRAQRLLPITQLESVALGAVGDSHIAGDVSGEAIPSATSWVNQLCARAGGTFYLRKNGGVGGETVAQIASRLDAYLAAFSPKVLIIGGGTNDVVGSIATDTTIAGLVGMIRAARTAGVIPVLVNVLPLNYGGFDVTPLNTAIAKAATDIGVQLLDVHAMALTSGGVMDASLFKVDGIHLNATGAIKVADGVLAALNFGQFAPSFLPAVNGESWNKVTNPKFTRSTGAPTGWNDYSDGGVKTSNEYSTDAGGVNWWKINKLTEDGTVVVNQTLTAPGFTVGNRIAFGMRIATVGITPSVVLDFGAGNAQIQPAILNGIWYYEGAVPVGTDAIKIQLYCATGVGSIAFADPFCRVF